MPQVDAVLPGMETTEPVYPVIMNEYDIMGNIVKQVNPIGTKFDLPLPIEDPHPFFEHFLTHFSVPAIRIRICYLTWSI